MRDTTLVIMAAGLGSRFGGGGVKQLTSFGPNGEIIMDYSIYDAIEAGFNKIVFVIQRRMLEDFKNVIGDRIAKYVKVEYAFQAIEDIPAGCVLSRVRKKPWGTGQAILACQKIVQEPFAVTNADDYYGKDAFHKVHDFLTRESDGKAADSCYHFCMAGFVLKNTLSEFGGVTRGICRVNEHKELVEILETKNIVKTLDGAAVKTDDGSFISIDTESLVSMNFWGFTPDFMDELRVGFVNFLENLEGNEENAEYLLPTIVDRLLKEKRVELTVLPSADRWFGVTFREDVPFVKKSIEGLIEKGRYPQHLFP